MNILVIDVGGSNVKIMVTGQKDERRMPSGPAMTAAQMAAGVGQLAKGTSVDKAPEKISGMFDAIAGRYDLLNTVLSAGLDRYWRRRAIASLGLTGRERLLDVFTGTAGEKSSIFFASGVVTSVTARLISSAPASGFVTISNDFASRTCMAW